jgi:hypothetical protein
MTRSPESFDRLVITSSVRPSMKYCSLGSPPIFENGRTARLRTLGSRYECI